MAETIECDGSSNKAMVLVCGVAKNLQTKDINVSFSEVKDALSNMYNLKSEVKSREDIKTIIRPAMVKSEKAEKEYSAAFDEAWGVAFPIERRARSSEEVGRALRKK